MACTYDGVKAASQLVSVAQRGEIGLADGVGFAVVGEACEQARGDHVDAGEHAHVLAGGAGVSVSALTVPRGLTSRGECTRRGEPLAL